MQSLRRTPHRFPPPPDDGWTDLERALTRYLQLQNAELERVAAAELENRRQAAIRSAVWQLVTWLLLLTGYSLALGIGSRAHVLSALIAPQALADNAAAARGYTAQAMGWVPDAFRGFAITALSAGALLVFRSASFSAKSDLGGALFVGVAVLSLLGLSAAASSGPLGFMAALPGFAAALIVVRELLRTIVRLRGDGVDRGLAHSPRYAVSLDRWRRLVDPTRTWWLSAVFLGMPGVCLAVVAGSDVTHGGPLYVPSRGAMYAYIAWCVWACLATPGAVRIPLWSAVPWGILLFAQLADDMVGDVFVVAVVALLFVNVVLVIWGTRSSWARTATASEEDAARGFPYQISTR